MSNETFPFSRSDGGDAIDFLQNQFIDVSNTVLQLTDEIRNAFYEALSRLRKNEVLREQACRFHQLLFHPKEDKAREGAVQQLIDLEATSAARLGMLIPVILVSGLPLLSSFYSQRGIPLDVMIATLTDLKLNMLWYKEKYGFWGTNNIRWLMRHFTGNIFQLGRLQFHFHPFPHNVRVFRHSVTSEIAVFSGEEEHYRSDGCVDGTNGIYDPEWISRFTMTDDHIIGHLISREGFVRRERTRLPAKEWKPILTECDTVLKVHIPGGSKMSHKLCQASYVLAAEFFTKYFPETNFNAFFCATWLLGPQWRNLLSSESNIVKFQQDYRLFPILSNDSQTFERVFGDKPADLSTAPRDTQLRRALLDYTMAGNQVCSGAGIILKDEL